MSDPVVLLADRFRHALVAAFGPEHAGVDPAIRPSTHADYQANVALGLAKALKRPPRDVASAIVSALDRGDAVAEVEIAGPGFINVTLTSSLLSRELARVAATEGAGLEHAAEPERVVIDYSSPNVAKEMHVGHLRSTVIGDALARVFEALGHTVLRQNHLGDWGTPFGMLLEHLTDGGADANGQSIADLNAFYQAARAKFDADPVFAERARQRVVKLQAGDESTLALWRTLVEASRHHFNALYRLLGVTLTDADIAGESLFNPMLPEVIAELEAKGQCVLDDGAKCVFVPGYVGRDDKPLPLIAQKQDGGYGYATTDLAAIRYRLATLRANRILYVVGAPQTQHLAMIRDAASQAGWLVPPARAEHVAFGSVLGADGKVLRTRAGANVKLVELLEEGVERAAAIVREKNPELTDEERSRIARAVGIGAIKYADLSSDRVKDYVFDWSRMLAFDGNTAPYLQYAYARICSILRRADESAPASAIAVSTPEERALALAVLAFPTVVVDVAASLAPHRLCGYLYALATTFSAFYERCPVLKAATPEERRSRLALSAVTAQVLARGLDLLGIEAPEKM
ncbi:MAG: arginine--tRNA ligase [Deltaproteobacteria bacterium]|nr:arginine--tRNA ligase [Deltaproteobacteria bacterium]